MDQLSYMKIDVVPPSENFRGMSYGNWAALWSRWLLSEEPDNYAGGDVLFLRGNVDYKPLRGATGGPRHSDPKGIYNRTGSKGEKIFEGTAIFFPVVNALLSIGELYDGRLIKNEFFGTKETKNPVSQNQKAIRHIPGLY